MMGMADDSVSTLGETGDATPTVTSDGAAVVKKGFPERKNPKKVVKINGLTCAGMLREMQIVFHQHAKYDGNNYQKRFRHILRTNPDKFLATMRKEEKILLAETDEAKAHAAEFERLQAVALEYERLKESAKAGVAALREEFAGKLAGLEADLTAARSRVAELELLVPRPEEDEYAHPNIQRLEELHLRLIRE